MADEDELGLLLDQPDESDENSAAAAEALVADTERRTQAWLAARDAATATEGFDLDITSGLTGEKVAVKILEKDKKTRGVEKMDTMKGLMDLHDDCDWLIQNYESRKAERPSA